MMESRLSAVLFSQVTHLPFLLVLVVGIVLSIVRWSAHPKVSMLSLLAFAMMLVSVIARMGYLFWLIGGQDSGMAATQTRHVLTWINLSMSLFDLVGWVLLLIALFGWRRSEDPTDA